LKVISTAGKIALHRIAPCTGRKKNTGVTHTSCTVTKYNNRIQGDTFHILISVKNEGILDKIFTIIYNRVYSKKENLKNSIYYQQNIV
jgi:hypothetical protein